MMNNFNKAKKNKDKRFVGEFTSGAFSGIVFILTYIAELFCKKKGVKDERT